MPVRISVPTAQDYEETPLGRRLLGLMQGFPVRPLNDTRMAGVVCVINRGGPRSRKGVSTWRSAQADGS